ISRPHQLPPYLPLDPLPDRGEAPGRVPDPEVVDPAPEDRIDLPDHPSHRLRVVLLEHLLEPPPHRPPPVPLPPVLPPPPPRHRPRSGRWPRTAKPTNPHPPPRLTPPPRLFPPSSPPPSLTTPPRSRRATASTSQSCRRSLFTRITKSSA